MRQKRLQRPIRRRKRESTNDGPSASSERVTRARKAVRDAEKFLERMEK